MKETLNTYTVTLTNVAVNINILLFPFLNKSIS